MTKRELIKALEVFFDDQEIKVLSNSRLSDIKSIEVQGLDVVLSTGADEKK